MASKLIVNADDFGAASAVNAAVVRARHFGLLTSVSLMVTGDAVAEAVSIAREDPGLAVGLHLAISDAKSALPREEIPDLVDAHSRFACNPAVAGLKYYFNRKARIQIRREIEAQFAAFAQTGLPLSHVDGHQHMHAHPAVFPHVVELAHKYGAHGIRIPWEPFWLNLRVDRLRIASKLIIAFGHKYLASVCRKPMMASGLASCEVSIGSLMSGNMNDDYVIGMLGSIRRERLEVYFHPADLPERRSALGPNPGDLRALLSSRLKDFILSNGYELTTYAGLSSDREGESARGRA
jgi:chitin disaccharide deacetylase